MVLRSALSPHALRGLRRRGASIGALAILLASISTAGAFPPGGYVDAEDAVAHLVISEVVTGGASASDEMIELYNPTAASLPTEGLELIYVTASGATITRKATWPAGSPEMPAGAHLLVANEAGIYATIADAVYAGGLSATGGSMALLIQEAASAIDAVGWGTAASTWLEGTPAPAAPAGHSLERLPGGAAGSGQDTDDNLVDFVDRPDPDPQNSSSPPIVGESPSPSASTSPTPTAPPGTTLPTVSPTPTIGPTLTAAPTLTATPAPTPAPLSIADARAMPDGTVVTVEGIMLTDSSFADGGGFISDASAGIAVLVADGGYARGDRMRVTGMLDDRYHQRTLRTAATDLVSLGSATERRPLDTATGAVGEAVEGRLVRISGSIVGAPTQLAGGLAFDVDDGSGVTRVVVGSATGIDTDGWDAGATATLAGVVGQRDSSGTGSAGYRVMPRDGNDIDAMVQPTQTPAPSTGGSGSPTASASSTPRPSSAPLVTISSARAMETGGRVRVRGVVTLASGLAEAGTAALQDASGAIVLRLAATAGGLRRGELVEVEGVRSTKAGMLTIFVSDPAVRLGNQAEPGPIRVATARLGEAQEASLVVVRGAVAGSVLTSSAGNVYFDLDDGSGPTRIYISPRSGISMTGLATGSWLEIVGVLLQETTGDAPDAGYRLWPRASADVRLIAAAASPSAADGVASGPGGFDSDPSGDGLPGSGGAGNSVPGYSGAVPPGLTIPNGTSSTPAAGEPASEQAATSTGTPGPPVAGLLLALGGLALAAAGGIWSSPGLAGRVAAAIGARADRRPDAPEEWELPIDAEPAGTAGIPPRSLPSTKSGER